MGAGIAAGDILMKPICVPCQRFFRPKQNGFAFIEGMPRDSSTPAGKRESHHWSPYKLWMGDLWICLGCGTEIVVGTGANRIAEHYEPDFAEMARKFGATLQVNDC